MMVRLGMPEPTLSADCGYFELRNHRKAYLGITTAEQAPCLASVKEAEETWKGGDRLNRWNQIAMTTSLGDIPKWNKQPYYMLEKTQPGGSHDLSSYLGPASVPINRLAIQTATPSFAASSNPCEITG
jgi:hypothetical protein